MTTQVEDRSARRELLDLILEVSFRRDAALRVLARGEHRQVAGRLYRERRRQVRHRNVQEVVAVEVGEPKTSRAGQGRRHQNLLVFPKTSNYTLFNRHGFHQNLKWETEFHQNLLVFLETSSYTLLIIDISKTRHGFHRNLKWETGFHQNLLVFMKS